ncbi:hypothetical protein HDU97_007126 [Phlyctochytrium planicorne]|nr:hypothetical protein HDU97_007126 [Phlyctochytrium planicorne]
MSVGRSAIHGFVGAVIGGGHLFIVDISKNLGGFTETLLIDNDDDDDDEDDDEDEDEDVDVDEDN